MNGTKSILDRISNLTSDDSKVLKEFNDRIKEANKNKEKAEEEKKSFEKDITNIQSDIDDITKASEISDRFSNLDSYMPGLEKLGKSVSLIESLKNELAKIPEQIEKLENKIKELTDESDNRSKTISDADDELSKLDVEISDAKRYQDNLVELINLAKTGNINKTREEVVETLVHVGFTGKEAVSADKIILFPEDDLIPYFTKETKIDNYEEEVKEEPKEEIQEVKEQEVEEEPIKEEEEKPLSFIDNQLDEVKLESMDEEEKLSPVDVSPIKDFSEIKNTINELGLDVDRFIIEDLDIDSSLMKENVKFLLDKNINKDFIYAYPLIMADTNLKDKYNYIVNTLNKTEEDLRLTPEILASYSKDDLEKLVAISAQTGINPSIIPLPVYVKGLQSFFRNYMVLKDNDIDLDENELSKFAIILAINPVDFKKSLQVLMDYKVSLKKNDGKYAIMDLAVKDSELANKMDMIINVGEEDLIKFYPEVLAGDVKGLVNRLLFLKKSDIPYKTVSHQKSVYQSFVLRQDVLDKVLERKIELNEVLDKNETNNKAKELIDDVDLMEELDKIYDNFEMVSNTYLQDYREVLKSIKNKYRETENSYIIDNISFSKNKVNRNINYLLSIFADANIDKIILASLLHDSRLSEDDMIKVINVVKGK
ncbi:MAG: hypothetical protein IJ572_04020 [Bacilli bacterium]|nr:hypothetical protein [Bacilli bacterium]